MGYTITEESFASLDSYWNEPRHNLRWGSIFVLPSWLRVWWQTFGSESELYLRAVRQGKEILGIAPLLLSNKIAYLVGNTNVCDYLDFVVSPGRERDFFTVLFDDLVKKGINHLNLRPLRPDSTVFTELVPLARERRYEILGNLEDVSVELDLPPTWEEYLTGLSKKQRHEVRRKLRRLSGAGKVNYRYIDPIHGVTGLMDTFLRLFSLSRGEKANFMNHQIEAFFRSLTDAMAEIGLLRFGVLELESLPASMIMVFDYNDSVYLYNSAYDPSYRHLSVGLLAKVLGIKEAIEQGKKKWDFLKGGEAYKYHLGGRDIPLYGCRITIK